MTSTTVKTKRPVHEFAIMDSVFDYWGETYANGEPCRSYKNVQIGTANSVSANGALRKYANANGLYGYSHLKAVDLTRKAEREAAEAKQALDLSLRKFMSGYTVEQFADLEARANAAYTRVDNLKTGIKSCARAIEQANDAVGDRRMWNVPESLKGLRTSYLSLAKAAEEERANLIADLRGALVVHADLMEELYRVGISESDWGATRARSCVDNFDYDIANDADYTKHTRALLNQLKNAFGE